MRYVLDERYRLRGWKGAPCGIYDMRERSARFVNSSLYELVLLCDACHEIEADSLSEEENEFLSSLLSRGVVRIAGPWDFLGREQSYVAYPARYRPMGRLSVTGACNLKCRHCFMSAPKAKHATPSLEELVGVADQLAECGVLNLRITGGEPLMRNDFLEFIDALVEREIAVMTISTNGWNLSERLLDGLEARGVRPMFMVSFDGVGQHDFLRGVEGSEERAVSALRMLQNHGLRTAVAMCLHRRNVSVMRESVNLLASLGVGLLKFGSMLKLGEWADPDLDSIRLTREEELEAFEAYIPQYFEDGAPLAIAMSQFFSYTPGDSTWSIPLHQECPVSEEGEALACDLLRRTFFIASDGRVAPCAGMDDCAIADSLPSLREMRLADILDDPGYLRLSYATVGDVRDGNGQCRSCEFVDRCCGGCRRSALAATGDFYAPDPDTCYFFKHGWEERIRAAAQPAFEDYLRRNPPKR